jgi:octaprenyl-diphosphate synthase
LVAGKPYSMTEALLSSESSFRLEDLKILTANDMQRVNQVITDNLASEVVLINQLSQHIIYSGGKRLRPMLVLLSAKACGYKGDDDALLAAVVEFIHTATLLHDDVVDDSEMRRGQETASNIWGNEAAVLVGDYLYSRAFQMMVRAQSMRIMDLLANATNTIAEGEVLQLLNINDPDTSQQQYQQVIYGKTACLFEAATQIGAILGNADNHTEQQLSKYGKHLGTAFQLVDDALDYSANSDELGKNVGDDLAGGLEHIDAITKVISETGALDYTHQQARSEATLAKSALKSLEDSKFKQALTFLADYAIERNH